MSPFLFIFAELGGHGNVVESFFRASLRAKTYIYVVSIDLSRQHHFEVAYSIKNVAFVP